MTSIRMFVLAYMIFLILTEHALPYLHGKRLFGVLVPGQIRYGAEGAAVIRRYERHLLPWSIACLIAMIFVPILWIYLGAGAAMIVYLIATLRGFAVANASAKKFAVASHGIRTANLTDADNDNQRIGWRFLLPLAVPCAAALDVYLHWQQIPERYAIHWAHDGTANGWATKTFAGLYAPPLFGALIIVFLAGISLSILHGSRRSSPTSPAISLCTLFAYMVAFGSSLTPFIALHPPLPYAVFSPLFASLIVVSLLMLVRIFYRMFKTANEPGDGDYTAPEYWRGGMVYYNPDDPAIYVQTPVGGFYTLNFGNRASWFLLARIVLYMTGMAVLAHALWR
ncbi:MAG: DUF1648 domain-containing protein [Terracidiphilus sp.]